LHPFDIKAVLLRKHAQHVVLIHFPIALFIAGVAFDFMVQWTKRATYAVAAYFNFTVAALSTIPAVITGIAAWQWALRRPAVEGHPRATSGAWMRVECADLDCFFDPSARPPEAGTSHF
jgi:uncharacterized membrane protein